MVLLGRVCGYLGGGEDRAQEQPGAVFAADQIAVLALPADAGGLGERFFHHRRGVDEDLHVAAGARHDAAGHLLEAALHHVVIVAVLRVDRDGAAVRSGKYVARVPVGAVIHGHHDDRAHLGPQSPRIAAALERVGDPVHGAVKTLGDELPEACRRQRDGVGAGHGDGVEAGAFSLAGDQLPQRFAPCRALRSRGPHSEPPATARAPCPKAAAGRTGATSSACTSRAPHCGRSSRSRRDSRGSTASRPPRGRHR